MFRNVELISLPLKKVPYANKYLGFLLTFLKVCYIWENEMHQT